MIFPVGITEIDTRTNVLIPTLRTHHTGTTAAKPHHRKCSLQTDVLVSYIYGLQYAGMIFGI